MVGLGIPIGAPDVPLAEHLRWLRRSLELLGQVSDPALEVLLLGKVARVLISVGDHTWRRLSDQMLARTGAPGPLACRASGARSTRTSRSGWRLATPATT
jgi:hypothetical protein